MPVSNLWACCNALENGTKIANRTGRRQFPTLPEDILILPARPANVVRNSSRHLTGGQFEAATRDEGAVSCSYIVAGLSCRIDLIIERDDGPADQMVVGQSQKNIGNEHWPGQIHAYRSVCAEAGIFGAIGLLFLCDVEQAAVGLSPNRMMRGDRQAVRPPDMLPTYNHASAEISHQPVDVPVTKASGKQAPLQDGLHLQSGGEFYLTPAPRTQRQLCQRKPGLLGHFLGSFDLLTCRENDGRAMGDNDPRAATINYCVEQRFLNGNSLLAGPGRRENSCRNTKFS